MHEKRKATQRERRRKYRANGICECGNKAQGGRTTCDLCKAKLAAWHQVRYQKAKEAVFAVYGQVCSCCGEADKRFLTLDHINSGGSQHRKEGARIIVYWLIKNDFPDGLQVLCWNCNSGRAMNGGICPHKDNYNGK